MDDELVPQSLAILPFDWNQWRALRVLRFHQLAEEGIVVPQEEISVQPLDVGRVPHAYPRGGQRG